MAVTAGGVGLWAVRRANRAIDGASADGWQKQQLPDAPEVTVEFPGAPTAADEPIEVVNERGTVVGKKSLRTFVARNPRDGWDYGVRVGRLKQANNAGPELDVFLDWRGNAEVAARELSGLVRNGELGPVEPTTCNGYPAVQRVVRIKGTIASVVRAVGIDDQDYALFVRGPGVDPDSPSVRRFFDSFRHAHVPPPTADHTPPTGDAFKPMARVSGWSAAAFTADGRHFYTTAVGTLTRYEFPSCRRVATFPISKNFWGSILVDEHNRRVFIPDAIKPEGINSGTAYGSRIERYDLSFDAGVANRSANGFVISPESAGRLCEMVLCGDYLFVLAGKPTDGDRIVPADCTLHRINPATMTCDRQMKIPLATGGLTEAPNGAAVYVVAKREQKSAAIWEIDPVRFEVRRELRAPNPALNYVRSIASGQLVLGGVEEYAHNLYPQKVRLLDPNGDGRTRRFQASSRLPPLVTDGRLLVTIKGSAVEPWDIELWDVEGELRTLRPRRLGSMRVKPIHAAVLSRDGKALLLSSGQVYWLAGAGDPPEVDPDSKWKE